MKILIVTDAAHPQINGVVRTLESTTDELMKMGHDVTMLTSNRASFNTFPLPSYPEIRLPWNLWKVKDEIELVKPEAIHIATEGTLGLAARQYCVKNNISYTTSYHTKLPEYIKERFPFIPLRTAQAYMRWFHAPSKKVLVTTKSMKEELESWNLHPNLYVWTRGVDLKLFNPSMIQYASRRGQKPKTKPRLMYAGRVSIEKNLEAFLSLPDELGDKVIVGDGPDREKLERRYPNVEWVGYRTHFALSAEYAKADVFVFPSKTDTFGLVMLESNACGTPVAAYPVTGPRDYIVCGRTGCIDDNLQVAVEQCLTIPRDGVRKYVEENYSWKKTAESFYDNLVPIKPGNS